MLKLIIGAAVALLSAALGGALSTLAGAPTWISVAAAILVTISMPLGAGDALAALARTLSAKTRGELAIYYGTVIAALEATNAQLLHPPSWLRLVTAVLIALAGGLGIRVGVTPLSRPRSADGLPLAPQYGEPWSTGSKGNRNANPAAAVTTTR
jgi:hypothetical protein